MFAMSDKFISFINCRFFGFASHIVINYYKMGDFVARTYNLMDFEWTIYFYCIFFILVFVGCCKLGNKCCSQKKKKK